MKWFFLISLLCFSCSGPKLRENKKPAVALDECSQGQVLNCFAEGLRERDLKNTKKAYVFFKQGCDQGHPFSCTELGLLERQMGNMQEYFRLQNLACEGMDSIACYNLACGYCVEDNQTKTLAALLKASSLGYMNAEYAVKDPDLKCVYNNRQFLNWISKIQKEKDSQFPISYDFTYISGMDIALRFPTSFSLTKSFPKLFVFEDKAQISIFLSPDSYSTCVTKLNSSLALKEGVSDLKKVNLSRNNFPVQLTKLKYIENKKQFNEIIYLTGNDKRCWIVNGVSSTDTPEELQEEINTTVTSLVVKPFNQASDEALGMKLKSDKLKFAGISSSSQGTGFYAYYNLDGIWHPKINSTSIYMGFFVSQKLEDDSLFKQRLGDKTLKHIPYGYEHLEFVDRSTKLVDGKLAIYYKNKAVNKQGEILVTSVFYQKSETKLPILLVHIQPKGRKELIDWESALKAIVIK